MVKHEIMGKSQLTAEQMKQFLLSKNPIPSIGGMDMLEFCQLYIEEGEAEGVRGDYAFAQSCYETGYFKFGNSVLPQQNNYAGIGATNNSSIGKGAWFDSQRKGVRAQIQHLKAYASYDRLNQEYADPRFKYVTRGSAQYLEDLAGKWAVPGYPDKYSNYEEAYKNGETYGQKILSIYNQIAKVFVKPEEDNNVVENDNNEQDKIDNKEISKNFLNSILGLFGKILGIRKK